MTRAGGIKDRVGREMCVSRNNPLQPSCPPLLVVEEKYGVTPLTWYRTGATSHSAGAMVKVLEKTADPRAPGLSGRDLQALNPNHLKLLAPGP